MKLTEAIGAIETCKTIQELEGTLQKIAENYGFAGFNFMDTGNPHLDLPFSTGTSGAAWEADYQSNLFVHVDHCLAKARRTNTPFNWGSVALPKRLGKKRPGAMQLMDAAMDHGFQEGLVVPYHFIDPLGRVYSSLVVFFWKDPAADFYSVMSSFKHELHIIMVYWAQHAVDLVSDQLRGRTYSQAVTQGGDSGQQLTDRERDVLSWAGRGKTVSETAEIMTISDSTVESHMKSILRKLVADNKTHAVVKAIYLGLIDV